MSPIKITYTRTRTHEPLVELDGGPFNLVGAECTPERLRALAQMFNHIAQVAENRPTTGRFWIPCRENLDV